MINCDLENRGSPNDISEWFYFVHAKLVKFAVYLEKETKDLSLDELILFFDTQDVLGFTSYMSNIFPPTIPVQDEFYRNVQILRNYKPNSYRWYGSHLALDIAPAAAVYKFLKNKNFMFVYAEPKMEKQYKDADNRIPGTSNDPYPYKKSLSYFRWRRIYLILKEGKYAPTNSYSYDNWYSDWCREGDKQ